MCELLLETDGDGYESSRYIALTGKIEKLCQTIVQEHQARERMKPAKRELAGLIAGTSGEGEKDALRTTLGLPALEHSLLKGFREAILNRIRVMESEEYSTLMAPAIAKDWKASDARSDAKVAAGALQQDEADRLQETLSGRQPKSRAVELGKLLPAY